MMGNKQSHIRVFEDDKRFFKRMIRRMRKRDMRVRGEATAFRKLMNRFKSKKR